MNAFGDNCNVYNFAQCLKCCHINPFNNGVTRFRIYIHYFGFHFACFIG